jgi:asparagine synthase (glutamine-hydrolysing)
LRKVSKKYLPHSTTEEKKLGFPLPMNEWMKDNRIKEILLDKSTIDRGVFNKISIEKFLNQNQSDFDEYDFSGKKIWMMVNFELWAREHFN